MKSNFTSARNAKCVGIFIALFIFSTASSCLAQGFRLGLRIQPSLAWMKPDFTNASSGGTKVGFAYGIGADYYFAENYAITSGVDITYKGGIIKYPSYDTRVNLQYIEIPVALKMRTSQIGKLHYVGQFGLGLGFKIGADADIITNGNTTNVKFTDETNPINLSLVIGGGIEYPISGKTALTAGLLFNNGFTDVLSNKNAPSGTDPKATVNSLALSLGILF